MGSDPGNLKNKKWVKIIEEWINLMYENHVMYKVLSWDGLDPESLLKIRHHLPVTCKGINRQKKLMYRNTF